MNEKIFPKKNICKFIMEQMHIFMVTRQDVLNNEICCQKMTIGFFGDIENARSATLQYILTMECKNPVEYFETDNDFFGTKILSHTPPRMNLNVKTIMNIEKWPWDHFVEFYES